MLVETNVEEEEVFTEEEIDAFKVKELKAHLKKRNLDVKGLKAVLQERLKEYMKNLPNKSEITSSYMSDEEDPDVVEEETAMVEETSEAVQEQEEVKTKVEVQINSMDTESTIIGPQEPNDEEPTKEEPTSAAGTANEVPKSRNTVQTTGFVDLSNVFPVWIGDLPLQTCENDLILFFSDCGEVVSVKLSPARAGSKNIHRKYCFVNFTSQAAQLKAVEKDGAVFKGQKIQVKARENSERWRKIFVGNVNVTDAADLESELKTMGDWKIQKIQMKEGQKFAFCFFNCQDEANRFYDDLQNVEIRGQAICIEFPRTKEEREAIRSGVEKSTIEKCKRTIYINGLKPEITEEQILDFCSEHGEVLKTTKPKSQRSQHIAFVEFKRKTDADRFVVKFGEKGTQQDEAVIEGCNFSCETSKLTNQGPRSYNQGYGGYGNYYANYSNQGYGNYGGHGSYGGSSYYGGYGGYSTYRGGYHSRGFGSQGGYGYRPWQTRGRGGYGQRRWGPY